MVHQPKKLKDIARPYQKKTDQKISKQANKKSESSSKRKISSIESQKKPGRYNIYIDGQYAFAVDEQVLIDFMLAKGKELTPELEKEIQTADQWQKAYHKALDYISYQLRSEKEVRNRLEDYPPEWLDSIIEKLKSLKLIDDLNYAQSFVRTKASINQYGPQKIKQQLFKKGIEESLIEKALDEYSSNQQLDNALYWIEKQNKKNKKYSSRQCSQKIKQYLLQKGFDFSLIQSALDRSDIEKTEDEEYAALVKQGEKAWRRYSKFSLKECKQKTLCNLYSKAFPMELINQFISQKEREWHEEENELS